MQVQNKYKSEPKYKIIYNTNSRTRKGDEQSDQYGTSAFTNVIYLFIKYKYKYKCKYNCKYKTKATRIVGHGKETSNPTNMLPQLLPMSSTFSSNTNKNAKQIHHKHTTNSRTHSQTGDKLSFSNVINLSTVFCNTSLSQSPTSLIK